MADRIKVPAFADLPAAVWRTPVLIRFSHCDPAGIVYFARYFDIANGVVEDWFAEGLGLSYHDFIGPRRIGLGYANCGCDFLRPARMGEEIVFAVEVDRIGNASVGLTLYGYRDGDPVLAMTLVMVTTSLLVHRPVAVPDDLRVALEKYREECR